MGDKATRFHGPDDPAHSTEDVAREAYHLATAAWSGRNGLLMPRRSENPQAHRGSEEGHDLGSARGLVSLLLVWCGVVWCGAMCEVRSQGVELLQFQLQLRSSPCSRIR
jgi:hypothetical protein